MKYGDVFQLSLNNGFGFVQCVKEAPKTESEIIRVLPGAYDEKNIDNIEEIVRKRELFFLHFPVKYAINKKFFKPVGNFPVPVDSLAPRFFRTEHMVGTEFVGWHIVDSETLQRKLVKTLSYEERKLSEWGVISVPDLVERIESGWTPETWV